ncbi:MAG: D-alanine--D-alanine ligase [Bacteroidetes bacterium]|nr:D-alanine--D-alanine ligase [Bacteroidota bacterium]
MRIGILFGGSSREREISFAGGRTVYDNLNKSLFDAVPIFVDSFGNFVELRWEYIYKGSVRDFYPPVDSLPTSENGYQIYAENIGKLTKSQQKKLVSTLGKVLSAEDLKKKIDFAFLCLHGPNGEDGRIQGLLEYLSIPYSGAGILSSAIGIDKTIQKELMINAGFKSPSYFTIKRNEWVYQKDHNTVAIIAAKIKSTLGFPCVVKSATQGSSIGISIVSEESHQAIADAIDKSFFCREIKKEFWETLQTEQRVEYIRVLTDIREGIGMPVDCAVGRSVETIYHPEKLLSFVNEKLEGFDSIYLEGHDAEAIVLIEQFIEGKEFSCIVVQNEHGNGLALPPTEIRKGKELFDYRSKYLPGLSRKITPIELPDEQINKIRTECERLFRSLNFGVYARIDGFINGVGEVFLNDPNTTSGMMPSSFFFHQAAEIGLNPSQFLTYIIRTSIAQRVNDSKNLEFAKLVTSLDKAIDKDRKAVSSKIRIGVLLGGYSSERHISVESGRNIYEKLSSSTKYEPIPIFLTGSNEEHELFQIPINILLKDNADDIKEKINNFKTHPVVRDIITQCSSITSKYAAKNQLGAPQKISYSDLTNLVDGVFIALHGRPGEDGAVQEKLDKLNIPYNGSGVESSRITIDKYRTNEILKQNGLLIANHLLVSDLEWHTAKNSLLEKIVNEIKFPLIAKPVDDGCSSAVKKIKSIEELEAFAELIFRTSNELNTKAAEMLHIKPKEEFPSKKVMLIEELISKRDAIHFLEITGGMLTKFDEFGRVSYEVFEASEALSEGDVLSLEEKFLAGQGQNITPARYSANKEERQLISNKVKEELGKAAKILNINGYTRIDAFVRVYDVNRVEVIFIEVNSLPGMTPATCIFHQSAINGYKPFDFIDKILDFGFQRKRKSAQQLA